MSFFLSADFIPMLIWALKKETNSNFFVDVFRGYFPTHRDTHMS